MSSLYRWIGAGLAALIAAGVYYFERRRRLGAEARAAGAEVSSTVNAEAAKEASERATSLELERAKGIVTAYQEAIREARKRTDAKDSVDRANSALNRMRLADDDEGN